MGKSKSHSIAASRANIVIAELGLVIGGTVVS
jgi:hypothetical protein